MRVAVKLGYTGESYFGYQRQADKVTIEGCIIQALQDTGLILDPKNSRFASAGRTDRGVNALGQVIAFDPVGPVKAICMRLNSKLPKDIFALGWAEVDEEFNPRTRARSKTYLYLFDHPDVEASALDAASKVFIGKHDFSQFCRPSERNTVRSIDEIRVEGGKPTRIFFTSRGFLWTQVRRVVSAMELLARKDLIRKEVIDALNGMKKLSVAPAPPQNLILWSIDFSDVVFHIDEVSSLRAKEFLDDSIRKYEIGLAVRRTLLAGIDENAPVA